MTERRIDRLRTQVAEAAREQRKLMRYAPYLFPAYNEVENAKAELKAAQVRLKAAREEWNRQKGRAK
jgi:D-serine dehydratase